MTDELSARVKAWLARSGHPFELRIGHSFREAGWTVEFARIYRDLESGKPRPVDVLATLSGGERESKSAVSFHYVVESSAPPILG